MLSRSHLRPGCFCEFPLAVVLVFFLHIAVSPAQILQHQKSTELLIKQYESLVAKGSLLTPEGWARTAKLFEHSGPYPADGEIQLISAPGIIGETERNGDDAKVETKWGDCYGTIDSQLQYKPPVHASIMCIELFSLVFEHQPKAREGAAEGLRGWLIEGPLLTRSADIPHAISYVQRMRDQSNNPAIHRNAERTLAALKRQVVSRGCGSASACQ